MTDAPTLLAQRDEAVALLRELRDARIAFDCDFTNRERDAIARSNIFLSRLDKEAADASD